MKYSISNLAWEPEDRLDVYAKLAQLGFSGLEIVPNKFFFDATDCLRPKTSTVRQALKEAKNFGLEVVSMQSILYSEPQCNLFGASNIRSQFVKNMFSAIEVAARLDAKNIVFGSPKQRYIPVEMGFNSAKQLAVETFKVIGVHAASHGVKISIEPAPKNYGANFLNDLNEVYDFINLVNSDAIKINLDFGALIMNNETNSFVSQSNHLVPDIGHVHVSEPYLECLSNFDHAKLLLQTLLQAGYRNFVSLEMKHIKDNLKSFKTSLSQFSRLINEVANG